MKILYVGTSNYGSLSSMRMKTMIDLGNEVDNIDPYAIKCKPLLYNLVNIAHKIFWHLGWPLDINNANNKILEYLNKKNTEMVWVDKGVHVRKQTLLKIKLKHPKVKLIHFNPDDPFGNFGKAGWRWFIGSIPYYDLHFVPRVENIKEYKALGARDVVQILPFWGFDPSIHKPAELLSEAVFNAMSEVVFLGAYELERYQSLLFLANNGIRITLMHDWPEKYWHQNFIRLPGPVYGMEYARTIASFKIALGYLRKGNRDEHTSRSVEIPACGTLMLAERTAEHQILFAEGLEADFFSTNEELLDKVNYYVLNDKIRKKISISGYERCKSSGYDYRSITLKMLELCENL
jgi:hypothetical protein